MQANGHDNTRCRRGPPAPYCLIPSRSPGLSSTVYTSASRSTLALLALRRCKGKGVLARGYLKAAWNEGAGRGARTGYEVWYRRDERAHDREVLHPHMGGALCIRRSLHRRDDRVPREASAVPRAVACHGSGLSAASGALIPAEESADGRVGVPSAPKA